MTQTFGTQAQQQQQQQKRLTEKTPHAQIEMGVDSENVARIYQNWCLSNFLFLVKKKTIQNIIKQKQITDKQIK